MMRTILSINTDNSTEYLYNRKKVKRTILVTEVKADWGQFSESLPLEDYIKL